MHSLPLKFRWLVVVVVALSCLATVSSAQMVGSADIFHKQFKEAMAKNDYGTMRGLVKANRMFALTVATSFMEPEYCDAVLKDNSDKAREVVEFLEQLSLTFKLEHSDNFLQDRKKWLLSLDDPRMKGRLANSNIWNDGVIAHNEAKKTGGDVPYQAAEAKLLVALKGLEAIDDHMFAMYTCERLYDCRRALADDFGRAYYAMRGIRFGKKAGSPQLYKFLDTELNMIKTQDKIKKLELVELTLPLEESRKDYRARYEESLKVKDGTITTGDGKTGSKTATTGSGKVLVPPTSAAEYAWVEDTGFKVARAVNRSKVHLPFVNPRASHENPFLYPFSVSMVFAKDGPAKDFYPLPGAKMRFDGKAFLDIDAAGKKKEKQVKFKQKAGAQTFNFVHDDGSKAKLTYLFAQKPGQEKLFNFSFRDPTASQKLVLRTWGVSSMTGKIRGADVTLVDSSASGTFDDAGFDTLIIGKGKAARVEPYGRYVFLEDQDGLFPYEIKIPLKNGSKVRTRPFKGDLAPLQVEFTAKAMPEFLLVKGSGEDSAFYFDAMKAVEKPVWVPIGTYTVHNGYIVVGKGKKAKHLLIGKGQRQVFRVEGGKLNKWALGGAGEKGFWCYGGLKRSGEKTSVVELAGKDIRVFGNHGEEYFNFLPGRIQPTVELRKEDSKGSKITTKKMKMPSGNNVSVQEAWCPANLKMKNVPSGKVVARITIDYPSLGHIESDWITVSDF